MSHFYFDNSSYIFLFFLVLLTIYLIKMFIKNKKKFLIPIVMIIIVYMIYSTFTYTGSVRLKLLTIGYPIKAYKTELKEHKSDKNKLYYPVDKLKTKSGYIGLIKCKNYVIKICDYYGFG